MKKINLSLYQWSYSNANPFNNWIDIKNTILKNIHHNSDIIILPELCFFGIPESKEEILNFSCDTQKILDKILEFTKNNNLNIVCTLPRIKNNSQIFNTTYIFTPDKSIEAYNKIHLFAPMKEDFIFEKGDKPSVISIKIKNHEINVGFLTCFDLRFPEIARELAGIGAEILIVNALWPVQRINHFSTLLQARAIENQLFAVGVNAYGRNKGYFLGGKSSVIAPDGKILALFEKNDKFLTVQIDCDEIKKIRQIFNTSFSKNNYNTEGSKLFELEELKNIIRKRKAAGQKMVFTNGCFDILHAGHVSYLEKARSFGAFLVLGLNSDESVRRLKGESRPVNNQQLRAKVLNGLQYIDYICIFNEDNPLNLITGLVPDVLVKGADWKEDDIVGAKFVKEKGGIIQRIPFEYNTSTTKIIEKINFSAIELLS